MIRLFLLSFFLTAFLCVRKKSEDAGIKPLELDRDKLQSTLAILAQEPHPMGSPRQKQLADFLSGEARAFGLNATVDSFQATVPDPEAMDAEPNAMRRLSLDLSLQNIYAKLAIPGSSCVILLGSHYDSKRMDEGISLGANDSGSSSALLLELMRTFSAWTGQDAGSSRCSLLAVWFDGEEAYLQDWRDGETRHPSKIKDHLYGSRHLANRLERCGEDKCLPKDLGGERIQALILLDMVGMPNVRLTPDLSSDPALLGNARKWDERLFQGKLYRSSSPKPIEDDHIPFRDLGIPVLDLIDFENTHTWHTTLDNPDSLSLDSMVQVGQLASVLIQDINQAE